MKKIQTTVYISDDGKTFNDEKQCAKYEKKLSQQKIFAVRHSPDLTEGRGMQRCTVFIAPPIGFDGSQVELMFEDFCQRHFGRKVGFVQGVQATTAWQYVEIAACQLPFKFGFAMQRPIDAEVVQLAIGEKEIGYEVEYA